MSESPAHDEDEKTGEPQAGADWWALQARAEREHIRRIEEHLLGISLEDEPGVSLADDETKAAEERPGRLNLHYFASILQAECESDKQPARFLFKVVFRHKLQLYKCFLSVHMKQLEAVQTCLGKGRYFPLAHSFPKLPKGHCREKDLQLEMAADELSFRAPRLAKSFRSRQNAVRDAQEFIQRCFCSPALLCQDWFFRVLTDGSTVAIPDAVQLAVQLQAHKQLLSLANSVHGQRIDLQELRKAQPSGERRSRNGAFCTLRFHAAWVLAQPLKSMPRMENLVNHWALVLEAKRRRGAAWLLYLDFNDDNKVQLRLYPSTSCSRRALFFSAATLKDRGGQAILPQPFTRGWRTLLSFSERDCQPLRNVRFDGDGIGHVVSYWLKLGKSQALGYSPTTRNCQHFVLHVVRFWSRCKADQLRHSKSSRHVSRLAGVFHFGNLSDDKINNRLVHSPPPGSRKRGSKKQCDDKCKRPRLQRNNQQKPPAIP